MHQMSDGVSTAAVGLSDETVSVPPAGTQEVWNSMSVHGVSGEKTTSTIEEASDRLFRNERKAKVEKTANDALLSTLPTDTLRFLKKRRKLNSFEKVPLTIYREQQLRAIFNGLDFDKMGTIHLDLVKDAACYAEEKLRPKKGKPVFNNIQRMFEAMDEDGNGDGEVDFHEFTIAMTGSATSTMDSVSEYDVERLTKRFIEFANIQRRERALECVKAYVSPEGEFAHTTSSGASVGSTIGSAELEGQLTARSQATVYTEGGSGTITPLQISKESYDAPKLEHFRQCFSVFNSRCTDESVEQEIEAYYESKGIKRKGTIGVGSPTKSKTKNMKSVDEEGSKLPQFKNKALRTQKILDEFLSSVSDFTQTEVSPTFMAKVRHEKQAALNSAASATSLESEEASAEPSVSPEDDEDMPLGIVKEVLTWEQEREKREQEFIDIQKRRARQRLNEADAAMSNLDQIENQMRWDVEQKFKIELSRKPWLADAKKSSVPMYSNAASRMPTLIPLADDKVVRTQMRYMLQSRSQIAVAKAIHVAKEKSASMGNLFGDDTCSAAKGSQHSLSHASSGLFSVELRPLPTLHPSAILPPKLDHLGNEIKIKFNDNAVVGNQPKRSKKKTSNVRMPVAFDT